MVYGCSCALLQELVLAGSAVTAKKASKTLNQLGFAGTMHKGLGCFGIGRAKRVERTESEAASTIAGFMVFLSDECRPTERARSRCFVLLDSSW